MRVSVIGAGLMGAQIGCEYALGGHDVRLVARDTAALRGRVEAALGVLGTHGLAGPEEIGDAPHVLDVVRRTLVALGKQPVMVQRDVPGFVWNRLQFALVRECVWLVEQGVASAETIDEVMRTGLARRWRHVGPLRAMALGGIDTWNRSAANIVPQLSTASSLPDLHDLARTDGDLGADASARDAALARELREGA